MSYEKNFDLNAHVDAFLDSLGEEADGKSLLEIEQQLLLEGHTEESLSQLYPWVVGNGHPSVCLCRACAPGEYMDYDVTDELPSSEEPAEDAHVVSLNVEDIENHPF